MDFARWSCRRVLGPRVVVVVGEVVVVFGSDGSRDVMSWLSLFGRAYGS